MDWTEAQDLLGRLAASPQFGLISDIDGTLSPIVDHPEDAKITRRNRELLDKLNKEIALVALVSGRAAKDAQERVGLRHLTYIGNHGLEHWHDGELHIMPEVATHRPALEAAATELRALDVEGVHLEDKGATLSLHYRLNSDSAAFAESYATNFAEVAEHHGLKLSSGRMVFEFKPQIEADKGTALRSLIEEHKLDAALYIGDDTTDVAALKMARQSRETGLCDAWGGGVQSGESPEEVAATADFLVSGVEGVEELLSWLLIASKASST